MEIVKGFVELSGTFVEICILKNAGYFCKELKKIWNSYQ
jgi:hypothetical protein